MQGLETVYGYKAGLIGAITQLHGEYYASSWNFTEYFEAKVATELSDFMNNYDKQREVIISLYENNVLQGSISVQKSADNPYTAQLRWFIVSSKIRGRGSGNLLMKEAMDFCKKCKYSNIFLWTFNGLDSAKHLYEKYGFTIKKESQGNQWGTIVTEVCYEIKL